MAQFRLQQFNVWLTEIKGFQDKKILEIGSGRGEYLELFKQLGVNVFGVEHSKGLVAAATAAGHTVEEGYLGDAGPALRNGPFDAFVSFNFMEHWPDPGAVLSQLHAQLRSGAVGLIEVPNFDMILNAQLFSEFIPDHLFYFTAETLRFTLQRFGYEVLAIDSIWSDYILSARVKKREVLNLDAFHSSKQKIIAEIRAYAESHASGGVAVWGAGHQALAMLSLAHLRDAVAFVVDSAPFKQKKYTPASNIYVDGPGALESGCVDTVIIMGAGYSEEILKKLRQSYPQIKHVAVLRDSHLEVVDA
jgi:SAM-dependent methyltransferase